MSYKDILEHTSSILNEDVLKIEKMPGGMTNFNYKLLTHNRSYIYRIPGNCSNLLISRQEEKAVLTLVKGINIDVETIYFDALSGCKITTFVSDYYAGIMNNYTKAVASNYLLKKLHKSSLVFENSFSMFEKLDFYESLIIRERIRFPIGYSYFKKKLLQIEKYLNSIHEKKCLPCHNDPVHKNILLDETNKLYLIDWEYAGMNDSFWDLAVVCLENDFDELAESFFLELYFGRSPTNSERKAILIYKIYQDGLWSLWAIIKSHFGDNFVEYGHTRYERAFRKVGLFMFSSYSPSQRKIFL